MHHTQVICTYLANNCFLAYTLSIEPAVWQVYKTVENCLLPIYHTFHFMPTLYPLLGFEETLFSSKVDNRHIREVGM